MPEQGTRAVETARDGARWLEGEARLGQARPRRRPLSHSATLTLGRTLMLEKSGAVNEDTSGAFKLLKSDGISGSCGGSRLCQAGLRKQQEGERGLWLARRAIEWAGSP